MTRWWYDPCVVNKKTTTMEMIMEEKKIKNLNMKFTEDDWGVLDKLCAMYGMDKTNMVRQSLRNTLKTRPEFVLSPRGEEGSWQA